MDGQQIFYERVKIHKNSNAYEPHFVELEILCRMCGLATKPRIMQQYAFHLLPPPFRHCAQCQTHRKSLIWFACKKVVQINM